MISNTYAKLRGIQSWAAGIANVRRMQSTDDRVGMVRKNGDAGQALEGEKSSGCRYEMALRRLHAMHVGQGAVGFGQSDQLVGTQAQAVPRSSRGRLR